MSSGGALMSCVREGSLEPPYRPHHDHTTNGEGRTGRFLRGLRRMFRRRSSGARTAPSPDPRSASTSELLHQDRHTRRKEGVYGSGLSVSHDSVFTGEQSGDDSSDDRQLPTHQLAHVTASHRAELVAAVRRRGRGDGSDDDEDLGLPRSPPASPPTDKADKRHHAGISQSSCSDGSLLSVGSSEMDEDSSSGHHHDHSGRSDHSDSYNLSEPPTGVAPLSHSAAKHKMAVRPRRKHGAPRRKKNTPITATTALPITPELNEEMIRSTTPEVTYKTTEVVTESFSSTTVTKHQMSIKEQHQLQNRELLRVVDSTSEAKLKSSSLPPGLALSQIVGQSPAKLSLADSNTPRSSIKRSKSSSQGQNLTDGPKPHTSTEINSYNSEEKMYSEKKSKSEKKLENEALKTKKEESFFSRLLLRKSGKKSKKDLTEGENQQEVKKQKTDKTTLRASEKSQNGQQQPSQKPVLAEKPQKSAGQRAFANQMHKRLDNKGAYVHESAYKDVYSAAKVAGVEYITDLKLAEETDRMLNAEPKIRYSRYEEHAEKIDRTKRSSSKEALSETRRESFNLHHDRSKRPASVQRLMEPFSTKAFISNEIDNRAQEEALSPVLITEDEPPIRAIKIPSVKTENAFHSGSMPKNLPYFNPSIVITSNASPQKTQNSIHVKHKSAEHISGYCDRRSSEYNEYNESIHVISKSEESYCGVRSLGDEYVESRGNVGKSHSFHHPGLAQPLLHSWEVNYRRNLTDRHDYAKRVSARNYNILGPSESNFDSLPSDDSSYLDSLKTDVDGDRKLFNCQSTVHITADVRKRDSDISQIEAKIDDIISSPKPIIASILKSSSLDSVKSSPEKSVEDRRKTISVDSVMSGKIGSLDKEIAKSETENFISVTMINKEQSPVISLSSEAPKAAKSDEKLQKSSPKNTGVPEFLNIQLNKIESKPTTNVVLTANVTPKKIEPQVEKEQEIEILKPIETKIQNIQTATRKDSFSSNKVTLENVTQNSQNTQPVKQTSPIPKTFFKKKSMSVEAQERPVKSRTNSVSTDGSTEKLDNISIDQKSRSSFGSKSSIQSTDSNEIRPPDRNEETVIFRKKSMASKDKSDKRKDDEPELMKVFARRSLKLKDSEVESVTHEISEAIKKKEEINETNNKTKLLKNEFNASIKSRDSDKENDDSPKEQNDDKKQSEDMRLVDIAARVSQFGAQYQRSVSIHSVTNNKRDSVPSYKSEVNKYKKEVSDSTPEKRLRNRTFPDSSNEREELKGITKSESYKADTLSKRPWQRPHSVEKERRESIVIEKDGSIEKDEGAKERDGADGEADGSPQFKGILQMRAEWERRAKQGMTK